jgi:hypothetical protein
MRPSKIAKEELPLLGNFESKPKDWCSEIFDEEWKMHILVNFTYQGSLDAIRGRLFSTSNYSLPDWLRAANLNLGSTFSNCRRKDLVTKQKKVPDGRPLLILRVLAYSLSPCVP